MGEIRPKTCKGVGITWRRLGSRAGSLCRVPTAPPEHGHEPGGGQTYGKRAEECGRGRGGAAGLGGPGPGLIRCAATQIS